MKGLNKTLMIVSKKILIIALILIPVKVFSQEMTANDMMQKYLDNLDARDETIKAEMTLIAKGGGERTRKMIIKQMKTGQKLQKTMIRFQEPEDIRGTSLLTWEQKGRADDQWIYLPALKQTKRIAGSERRGNFVGSDLSYEDLSPEKLEENQYTKSGEEQNAFIIEAVPVNKEDSGYSKRKIWLKKDSYLMIAAEYYDKKGNLLKTSKFTEIVALEVNKWRANRVEVKNVQNGHSTVMKTTDRKINAGLSEGEFTTRELEKGV